MKQKNTPSHPSQSLIINPDSFFGLTADAQQTLLERKIASEKERKQFIQGELFDLFLNHIGLHTSKDGLITFIDPNITESNSGIYMICKFKSGCVGNDYE